MQYLTGIAGGERDIVVAKPIISDVKKFLSSIDLQPSIHLLICSATGTI